MLRAEVNPNLTPRERAELDWEKEAAHMQVEYAQRIKEMDLQVRQLEVRWLQLLRLPAMIILLPVRLVLAFAIPISVITKTTLPDQYWEFLKG